MTWQQTSDLDRIHAAFQNFGEHQAPQNGSPLYQALSFGVLTDPEMLRLAACCPPSQPPPNLLFAAVHYLLLGGVQHPLRNFYPDVIVHEKQPRPPSPETYPLFRDFVRAHLGVIQGLLETRLVQTNVVRRTTCLLPLFAVIARKAGDRPLALIEVGASAGLNLHWDRYHHSYHFPSGKRLEWGAVTSPVRLSTAVRGTVPLPDIQPDLRVAWRVGIDLNPIDVTAADAMQWLRALIFPEHLERHHTIEAAAGVARTHPVALVKGDAVTHLPALLPQAPVDPQLCLYASMVLNQFSSKSRETLWALLTQFSAFRAVSFISMDGTHEGWSRLQIRDFEKGTCTKTHVANAHAHGSWLEWLDHTLLTHFKGDREKKEEPNRQEQN